jgi:glutamine synthetase
MPDPSCNPYLAFTVMLAAGLDGIKNKLPAGEPVNQNVFEMSAREKKRLKIDVLPGSLAEALDCLEKDDLLKNALGQHIFEKFVEAKRSEWQTYIAHVHPWEVDRYLQAY